eukprot:CAMPEP_0172630516 /NCGR_PEP_ID=MMETSP1068-20121228/174066_1 /TAXON_ID=35684 /ORGANISM="Pseudopedinella elastica, Strain CCMP716" /LENGTH=66 /DNA_ID=CAMNT_0013441379 /DNA_START=8 /DNA_END=205 /DNA_ORIENTATION=+
MDWPFRRAMRWAIRSLRRRRTSDADGAAPRAAAAADDPLPARAAPMGSTSCVSARGAAFRFRISAR